MSGGTEVPPRVAVVTGGSTGIGLAVVETLQAAGYRVAFFSQHADHVEAAREELVRRFPAAELLAEAVDIRDAAALRAFFDQVTASWAVPDALVCNAAISPKSPSGRRPLAEIETAQWSDVLAVNLTGTMLCCQCVLPGMAARRSGRIVLIGSIAGRTLPRIAGAAYSASKAGLAGLARSIVSEYAQYRVTANTICPGRIVSPLTGPADSPANRAALQRIPIGRLGEPNDVARAVEFLLHPGSDFINGAILDINGGEYAPS